MTEDRGHGLEHGTQSLVLDRHRNSPGGVVGPQVSSSTWPGRPPRRPPEPPHVLQRVYSRAGSRPRAGSRERGSTSLVGGRRRDEVLDRLLDDASRTHVHPAVVRTGPATAKRAGGSRRRVEDMGSTRSDGIPRPPAPPVDCCRPDQLCARGEGRQLVGGRGGTGRQGAGGTRNQSAGVCCGRSSRAVGA